MRFTTPNLLLVDRFKQLFIFLLLYLQQRRWLNDTCSFWKNIYSIGHLGLKPFLSNPKFTQLIFFMKSCDVPLLLVDDENDIASSSTGRSFPLAAIRTVVSGKSSHMSSGVSSSAFRTIDFRNSLDIRASALTSATPTAVSLLRNNKEWNTTCEIFDPYHRLRLHYRDLTINQH